MLSTEKSSVTALHTSAAAAASRARSWPIASGGAACISRASRDCAPQSGMHRLRAGERDGEREREMAEFGDHVSPLPFTTHRVPGRGGRRRPGGRVPAAALLQRVDHVLGHVVLVVLGQHLGGAEGAVRLRACPA